MMATWKKKLYQSYKTAAKKVQRLSYQNIDNACSYQLDWCLLVWCVVNVQYWRVTSMYWTGVLYVLDWCVACTGLVCRMYWTGVLHVLDWCVVCTGLVCCMLWTGVLYVLDWCVVCTGLVCCMYWTDVLYVLD